MKKKLTSVKGRQILVATLAVLVMASGYYRWTVDKGGDAVAVVSETLPEGEEKTAETEKSENKPDETDYFMKARYERDCARSEATELLKVSADGGENKNENAEKLAFLAKSMESEAAIENLVRAKGYADCVAFVDEKGVSVVVKSGALEAEGVAKIKDIVMDKTGVKPTDIKISSKE